MGQVDAEPAGRAARECPQYFSWSSEVTNTGCRRESKGRSSRVQPCGRASFQLLFLSRHVRPTCLTLFQICVESCEPPSRFHLQSTRHGHSSLDVSEETVVTLPSSTVPQVDLKGEKPSHGVSASAYVFQGSRNAPDVHEARNQELKSSRQPLCL